MKRMLLFACVNLCLTMLFVSASAISAAAPSAPAERVWNFDRDTPGQPPAGFASAWTGNGTIGRWVVVKDASAPSPPNVLGQVSEDRTDYRFPLAIVAGTNYKDFELRVKFKTISGQIDQGAGVIFRLQDKDNYYVVRANALEDNFRLYHVINGRRRQFAGANFKVTPLGWHEIRVKAQGDEFQCSYDGQLKFTASDSTFPGPGAIGFWTKADSVIYFDDLSVADLASVAASPRSRKIVAQKLVDEVVARHPELVRIGLHVMPPAGAENVVIASNIPDKIGQKSDSEDLSAMGSRRPVVLKEGNDFDVTLPLRDASGRIIGAIGLTFEPRPGEQEAGAVRRARGIVREIERKIPSRPKLFDSAG